MGRTFKDMKIEDKAAFVLFDTGALRSYVRKEFASEVRWRTNLFKVGIGGYSFEIDESCALNCEIEGLGFDIEAHPIEGLGTDERGQRIDAVIGAIGMEKWGLIPDPRTGSIDLTALRKREFIEF
ncbi:MAG: hypothetical protein ISS94_05650 [Candidatus Syntrophoarchaeum sp.]|nr:hypothetical protein [Candidatus Syntrophoarchaeum sp.]